MRRGRERAELPERPLPPPSPGPALAPSLAPSARPQPLSPPPPRLPAQSLSVRWQLHIPRSGPPSLPPHPPPLSSPPPLRLLPSPLCPELPTRPLQTALAPGCSVFPLALPPVIYVLSLPTSRAPGTDGDLGVHRGDPACADASLVPCPRLEVPNLSPALVAAFARAGQLVYPGLLETGVLSRCDSAAFGYSLGHLGFLAVASGLLWPLLSWKSRAPTSLLYPFILQKCPSGSQVREFFSSEPVCPHFYPPTPCPL